MLKQLGHTLLDARKAKQASLSTIAEPSNISATYLQKLERGQVGSPSPHVLARLASVLDIPYLRLMEQAGYLDDSQLAEVSRLQPAKGDHPLAGQQLSSMEWQQVGSFIRDLIAKR